MYCTSCGKSLPNDAEFCSACGRSTAVASAEQSQFASVTSSSPNGAAGIPIITAAEPFQNCPRCGRGHRIEVYRCAGCGLRVAEANSNLHEGWPPALDWNRGVKTGLGGYLAVQIVLIVLSGGNFDIVKVQWPMYALYAAYWTITAALNIGNGPSFGAVFGLLAVSLLVGALYGPAATVIDALMVALLSVFGSLLILAVIGLIRGRLEFLRLNTRSEVARLFSVAMLVLVVTSAVSGAVGARGRPAGSVVFGHDFTMRNGIAVIDSPLSTFAKGEQLAWVTTLSRPAHTTRLEMIWVATSNGGQSVMLRTPLDVASPDFQVFWNKQTLFLDPGEYIIRFVNGDQVLAEGPFSVRTP